MVLKQVELKPLLPHHPYLVQFPHAVCSAPFSYWQHSKSKNLLYPSQNSQWPGCQSADSEGGALQCNAALFIWSVQVGIQWREGESQCAQQTGCRRVCRHDRHFGDPLIHANHHSNMHCKFALHRAHCDVPSPATPSEYPAKILSSGLD